MEQAELIAQIDALTDAVEHAATMADWIEAARVADARGSLIALLSADQPPVGIAAIRRMQASNDRIFADAQHAQQQLTDEYQAAMSRVQAVGQYQSIANR
ncbi:TPA: flagellar protein FliT [Burkholderia vietnamiensis]|uniref:flagellar protein FliT n=1 Tax=Burkholderia vietnamiensis TaxID=60552 RepID=UPI001592CA5B|nr:flagellar protein FliT [Burkholderia vietnamiensis]MBR8216628.1 flagellar protein FliT [Burkholderia vietnamiensis]MCA8207318.1 flagellar protein FliT [Burkholderia vietnamiensis]HDR9100003.1 flagellar protein FliT [Burkholderia vietnamiensis]HDR9119757.1 flagellar protein FliT [Burkholderia vietnamiensis]HDR9170819.1 flagellar protein FliT [Burkholderia vietnamiensis]